MNKTIGIAGGTGFVGRHLVPKLQQDGWEVIVFTRGVSKLENGITYAHWNAANKEVDAEALAKCSVVVNLSGAGVVDHRWTDEYKQTIRDSRVKDTHFLLEQMTLHAKACKHFVAASAIGYYGPDRDGIAAFKETDPHFKDFLGEVCKEWEEASFSKKSEFRTVVFRFGIVMGKGSGAYPSMAKPTSFGVVPILGDGKQVVSWITVDDLSSLLLEAINDHSYTGVYNAVAPNPVTNKVLMHTIAKVKGGIKIPVPAPSFLLKMVMGEASVEVLKSTTVSAEKLLNKGFKFEHSTIEEAVRFIEKKK